MQEYEQLKTLVAEIESLKTTTSGSERSAWQTEVDRSGEARDSLAKR